MGFSDRPYSEKRDFIRMKIDAPLRAVVVTAAETIDAQCLDLSGGGLQVETQHALAIGTEADVEVTSGHGHNPTLKARVRVVRVIASESGAYLLGLEILEVVS